MKKTLIASLAASGFFAVFTMIYYRFSHQVYSDYMTYLALIPLLLGGLPALVGMIRHSESPGYFAYHLYFSGVAAIAMSSCLKGIFEIAGNSSAFQAYLMVFGMTLALAGALLFLVSKLTKKKI